MYGVAKLCKNVSYAVVKGWLIIVLPKFVQCIIFKNINSDVLRYLLLDS